MSSAEGTGAELAAPSAVSVDCEGTTSLLLGLRTIQDVKKRELDLPPNLKPSHSRLRADIPNQPIKPDLALSNRTLRVLPLLPELLLVELGVLVVPDADELLVLVRAREDERADAEDVLLADEGWVGRGRVEFELVYALWDGPDDEGVELLVELFVVWAGDEGELPLDVVV